MRNLERIREVEPKEMASILEEMKAYGLRMIRYGVDTEYPTKRHAMRSSQYTSLSACFLISETLTKIELVTTYHVNDREKRMYPITWVCSLNEQKLITTNGQKAYMQFQKAAHIPTVQQLGVAEWFAKSEITGKYNYSAIPMIGSRTQNKAVFRNVYEYDRVSAYMSVLLVKMPSFAYLDHNRVVGKGEIGWILTENLSLAHEGEHADFITELVDTPDSVKNYIMKWFKLKQTGSVDAKAMLNYCIGYYQRTNPLFRAYVVNTCNEIIKNLMDENTVLWNTDAIYTTKPLELDIGSNIGQWTVRIIDKLTVMGCNYQINTDIPTYRGIPKHWFEAFERINKRPFDLNKDELPGRINKWFMNWETLTLEELK